MKYSVSARQPRQIREKADEVIVAFKDREILFKFFAEEPNMKYILEVPKEELNDDIKSFILKCGQCSDKFSVKTGSLKDYKWFQENNIKFFYGYPVNSFFEIQGLIDIGVEYITIFQPITFDMPNLRPYAEKVKFRMVPNVAHAGYIPRHNGVLGQYVRPEDVQYYKDVIYIFDFENVDLKQERVLLETYQKGTWPGNLSLLITNLWYSTDNRGILEGFGERRSRCKQKCLYGKKCDYCQLALDWPQHVLKWAKENNRIPDKND